MNNLKVFLAGGLGFIQPFFNNVGPVMSFAISVVSFLYVYEKYKS